MRRNALDARVGVAENEIVLKIDENVRVKFARSAVSAIISREGEEDASS